MDHLIAILIMAVVSRGMAFIFSDGQVFGKKMQLMPGKRKAGGVIPVGKWLQELSPNLHKPLGMCGNCAVWTWGTLALYALNMLPDPLWLLPVYWVGAAGVQDLIDP